MRVAAVSFSVEGKPSFATRLSRAVRRAADRGADLIVLPELAVLGMVGATAPPDGPELVAWLAERADGYVELLVRLASMTETTIVGGSHIERRGGGVRNVCAIASPRGIRKVEKRVLTQWEANAWRLESGDAPSPDRDLGVLICYDCEFPELARPLALSGCRVLCVPSFTETAHGFSRVRLSCQARAIENQLFVVQASLVGSLEREPVPMSYGSSAILAPCVPPFPASGVLAETPRNRTGIAIADLDFDRLETGRTSGDVRNFEDSKRLLGA